MASDEINLDAAQFLGAERLSFPGSPANDGSGSLTEISSIDWCGRHEIVWMFSARAEIVFEYYNLGAFQSS